MVFSEFSFLFLILPLFLALDYICRSSTKLRNIVLIFISLVFYAWDGTHYFHILILYGVLNFSFGVILNATGRTGGERGHERLETFLLIVFVSANLFGLFYFKYLYWLVSNIKELFLNYEIVLDFSVKDRELPLGISFFTFHAISYLIDIYRRDIDCCRSITKFLTYFFMFPHLVAGPIVRFKDVQKELSQRVNESNLFTYGVSRFLLGINKKILIANSVAPIASMAFASDPESLSSLYLWLGAIAYTLQIYFDFSAYSDMAIGLAAMAGFRFHENFNAPYLASSMQDFWRRWHMSLSTWLRDYVYIPLGGSRRSPVRTYVNLCVVFFLCGLWHGANMTFIVWGLYNGVLLIVERLGFSELLKQAPVVIRRCYLILAVIVGWVLFRADDLGHAVSYLFHMFKFQPGSGFSVGEINLMVLILGIVISLINFKNFRPSTSNSSNVNVCLYGINFFLFFLSIFVIYFGSRNPFIYFNF